MATLGRHISKNKQHVKVVFSGRAGVAKSIPKYI